MYQAPPKQDFLFMKMVPSVPWLLFALKNTAVLLAGSFSVKFSWQSASGLHSYLSTPWIIYAVQHHDHYVLTFFHVGVFVLSLKLWVLFLWILFFLFIQLDA